MGSAAVAQTAGKTFECNLPYKEAMQAMAALTVTEQSELEPMLTLLGPGSRVEFAPASTQVFGLAPSALSLSIREPAKGAREKVYDVTFSATFPHDPAIDQTLIEVNEFRYCGDGSSMCQRDNDADDGPTMRYWRDPFFTDGKDNSPGRLECSYRLREEDIAG